MGNVRLLGAYTGAPGNSNASGYFGDPYSAYTTYWLDPLNGSDANPGTSQFSAKKTLQAGINLLTTGGSRLIVIPTATLPQSATVTFPASTGTSSSARVVVQGLPSANAGPTIVMAPNTEIYVNQGGVRDDVTFRKLEVYNSSTSGVGNYSSGENGLLHWDGNFGCLGILVEYCYLHNNLAADNTAAVRIDGAHTGAVFQYNKVANITTSNGSHNGGGIFTYATPAAYAHHNDISGCGTQFFLKKCSNASANNGWAIDRNILHDGSGTAGDGILLSEQGAGDVGGFFDTSITRNLFYNLADCVSQNNAENTLQSSRFQFAWNTCAQDVQIAALFCAMTAIQIHSNVLMPSTEMLELDYTSTYLNGISLCNNNAIYTGAGQQWWMSRFAPTGSAEFMSLATWQTAKSVGARPELTTDPDANSVAYSNIAANFPSYASRNYALAAGSALRGIGQGGTDPGYIASDCGPGW